MKRLQSQKRGADLVDDFWSPQVLQNSPESVRDEPVLGSEMELIAIAEALKTGTEKFQSMEYSRFLALHYALLQNSRMTFGDFVRTRFIPEHVLSKAPAGQRHYHAILKHILRPETVDTLFDPEPTLTHKRLISIPTWPYLDDVRFCNMSMDHVRQIVSAALDKGYSVQTVKHIRNVIGIVISHATERRYFSGYNPAFQVPLPPMIRRRGKSKATAPSGHA